MEMLTLSHVGKHSIDDVEELVVAIDNLVNNK